MVKYFKYMKAFEIHTNGGDNIGEAVNKKGSNTKEQKEILPEVLPHNKGASNKQWT